MKSETNLEKKESAVILLYFRLLIGQNKENLNDSTKFLCAHSYNWDCFNVQRDICSVLLCIDEYMRKVFSDSA